MIVDSLTSGANNGVPSETLITETKKPKVRWGLLWLAILVVFNALFDAPLTDLLGVLPRWLGEILTTGAATFAVLGLALSPRRRRRFGDLTLPLIIFVAYAVVQGIILKVHPVVVFYGIRAILRFPLVILFVAMVTNTDRERRWLLRLVFLVGFAEAALLIIQYLTPDFPLWASLRPSVDIDSALGVMSNEGATSTYPAGTFSRYNYAAEFVVPIALLAVGSVADLRKATLSGFWSCIIASLGAIVTFSRTAQLAVFLGVAVFFIKKKLLVPGFLVLCGLLSLAFVFGRDIDYASTSTGEPSSISARFLSLFSESYWEVQSEGELERWPAAIDGSQNIVAKHPLLGTGIGTIGMALTNSAFIEVAGAPYADYNRLPWLENKISLRAMVDVGWLCLLAQLGVVGLGLLGWMYWSFARSGRLPESSYLGRVTVAVWLAFFIFNSTSSAYLSRSFWSSAAIIIGVTISASRARSELLGQSATKS